MPSAARRPSRGRRGKRGLPLVDIPVDATVLLSLILLSPVAAAILLVSGAFTRLAKKYGAISKDRRVWLERRAVWIPAAVFLALYLIAFLYGLLVEAHWVAVTRIEIKASQPVLGRDRYRIVHLSDLHLERIGRREARMVERVREAKPDLILLTGDYINVREGAVALDEVLGALRRIAPVYGVTGNWDSKFITNDIFHRTNCELLVDDTAVIERDGRKLRLVGHDVYPKKPL